MQKECILTRTTARTMASGVTASGMVLEQEALKMVSSFMLFVVL